MVCAGTIDQDRPTPVDIALQALRRGEAVVLRGLPETGGAAALVLAAELATAETIAAYIEHTSGLISVALPAERLHELDLPLMTTDSPGDRPYTVTVDLAQGVTTGISAVDRAATIRALADRTSAPADFARPGHVLPLRSEAGGVLERLRHTEASVDLVRLAGLRPAAVVCALLSEDKQEVLGGADAAAFAAERDLCVVSIVDVASHRLRQEQLMVVESSELLAEHPAVRLLTVHSASDGLRHLVYLLGADPAGSEEPPVVGVHIACPAGDVFGAKACSCGDRLRSALAALRKTRSGVLVYLQPFGGHLDVHLRTSDATVELSPAVLARRHEVGLLVSKVLLAAGITRIRLLDDTSWLGAGEPQQELQGVEVVREGV